jgi:hypothetical protein
VELRLLKVRERQTVVFENRCLLIQEIRRKFGVLGKDGERERERERAPPNGDVSKSQLSVGEEDLF